MYACIYSVLHYRILKLDNLQFCNNQEAFLLFVLKGNITSSLKTSHSKHGLAFSTYPAKCVAPQEIYKRSIKGKITYPLKFSVPQFPHQINETVEISYLQELY